MEILKEPLTAAMRYMIRMALDLPHQDEITYTVSVFDEQFIILMEEQAT